MVSVEKGRLDFLVPLFFLSPFVILLISIGSVSLADKEDLLWAAKNSALQAFLSTLFNLSIGFFLALGLQSFSGFWRKFLEGALVIPSVLPSIFSIVLVLSLISPFPMGIAGIVIIHVVTASGLAAVLLAQLIEQKAARSWEIAEVFDLGTIKKWQLFLGSIRRELCVLGATFFVGHFLSFSVPLVVGGGSGTTIEVLIYEKIRVSQDFSGALGLSLLQVFCIGGLFVTIQKMLVMKSELSALGKVRASSSARIFIFLWVGGYLVSLLLSGLSGLDDIFRHPEVMTVFFARIMPSLGIAIAVGLLVAFFLYFGLYLLTARGLRFLNLLTPPSYPLLGLLLASLPILQSKIWYILGFAFLSVYGLLRLGWTEKMESLLGQVRIAEIFGISRNKIVRKIVFPQMRDLFATLTALSVVWTMGDFAFARIFFLRDETLAMVVQSLLGSYRIILAQGYALILAMISLLVFVLVRKAVYVFSEKS